MRSRVKPADSISILSNSGRNREMKKHEGKQSNFEVVVKGLHPPQDKMLLAGSYPTLSQGELGRFHMT